MHDNCLTGSQLKLLVPADVRGDEKDADFASSNSSDDWFMTLLPQEAGGFVN